MNLGREQRQSAEDFSQQSYDDYRDYELQDISPRLSEFQNKNASQYFHCTGGPCNLEPQSAHDVTWHLTNETGFYDLLGQNLGLAQSDIEWVDAHPDFWIVKPCPGNQLASSPVARRSVSAANNTGSRPRRARPLGRPDCNPGRSVPVTFHGVLAINATAWPPNVKNLMSDYVQHCRDVISLLESTIATPEQTLETVQKALQKAVYMIATGNHTMETVHNYISTVSSVEQMLEQRREQAAAAWMQLFVDIVIMAVTTFILPQVAGAGVKTVFSNAASAFVKVGQMTMCLIEIEGDLEFCAEWNTMNVNNEVNERIFKILNDAYVVPYYSTVNLTQS
ncbi:hypothetical protein RI367_006944 [Sorochytrium milnesiophthora]